MNGNDSIGAVRAKFVCTTIEEFAGGHKKVKMGAVYSQNTAENADFSDASPSGSFEIMINAGRPAANAFVPGKKYYLTLTEAPD